MKITIEQIKSNPSIQSYIRKADESLIALGYTEHSFPHVTKVAETAKRILLTLGYPAQETYNLYITKKIFEAFIFITPNI